MRVKFCLHQKESDYKRNVKKFSIYFTIKKIYKKLLLNAFQLALHKRDIKKSMSFN